MSVIFNKAVENKRNCDHPGEAVIEKSSLKKGVVRDGG